MRSPRAVLEDTDWDSLSHAYDSAGDVPERLVGLLSEDAEVCGDVLAYLDAVILHQETICSATAPVALFVAGVLDDPRVRIRCESALPWDERERPLRASLLEWLGNVAASAAYEDDDEDEYDEDDDWVRAVEACRAVRPELYARVVPFLDDGDPAVRQAAIGAVTHLVAAPDLADRRGDLADRLVAAARHATPVERAGVALTLGAWGVVAPSLSADDHPGVRACAALGAALDGDPAALDELRSALCDPVAADSWFAENPPQLDGRIRFALVEALLRRTTTFEEVVDAAVAVARMTNSYTVDRDWGPLLVRAFPEGFNPERALTGAQRRFLVAVVDNDECWEGVSNPVLWFRRAGLPSDRDGLRALLA
ncbi:hypothetical protein ACIQMJ_28345 [Actinosynnema sp. NPDC091369]